MSKRVIAMLAAVFALSVAVPLSVSAGQRVVHVHDGETIQAAIDVAAEGDKIIVHLGNYYENVTVDRTISLKGEEGAVVHCGTGHGFYVVANGVSIQGFSITGLSNRNGIHIATGVSGCVIKKNVIENKLFAIRVFGHGNTIIGNECIGSWSAGIGIMGNQNTVAHNLCHANQYGIAMRGDQNAVGHNACYNNIAVGILTQGGVAEENMLMHNLCYDNGVVGMALGGTGETIAHNICYRNIDGIRVSGTWSTFERNICIDNSENGFWVFGSDNCFEYNIARYNLIWDLLDEGYDNVYVMNVFGTTWP